jgi:DNA-binding transcriptional ArsR family regulator
VASAKVTGVQLLDDPGVLGAVSSPLRRRLLERLRGNAASAAEVAAELGLSRQLVNYHLRALEEVGLVEVVGERKKRGFVERLLQATTRRIVVDPDLLDTDEIALPSPGTIDRHAAEHLAATAGRLVRDVATLQAAAERAGKRLLTFTIETDVRVASPADVERFAEALADAVAATAAEFDAPRGRHYRVVVGGHPRRGEA